MEEGPLMTALDHTNPDQLRMFVPAREIVEQWGYADQRIGESREAVMADKVSESKIGGPHITHGHTKPDFASETHYESIQREGVKEPVSAYKHKDVGDGVRPGLLGEGHHRVAASYDIDPSREIPVSWQR